MYRVYIKNQQGKTYSGIALCKIYKRRDTDIEIINASYNL